MSSYTNSLHCLLQALPGARVVGETDIDIKMIDCDSRSISDGGLFVAINGGEEQDRHDFVSDAVTSGAVAVVVERAVAEIDGVTTIEVEDCRDALAVLASRFFAEPASCLCNIGVTGTNGKTTTAMLIRAIVDYAGQPGGYIGTLGCLINGKMTPLANTTPEASVLHRELRAMVDAGLSVAVMEVSSHALVLRRVSGIEFDVAVFTNLSRDHLDFHQTEERYFAAKRSLFDQLKPVDNSRAVVNLDDPFGSKLIVDLGESALTYGRHCHADVRLVCVDTTREGMKMVLDTPWGEICVKTVLTGDFNCSNVMAAIACALALGIDPHVASEGLACFEGIPGRFERVDAGQSFDVIVDYAHTPAGLETVLKTARELTDKKLICLFGCGGDRDVGKRSEMGRIASELADVVFLTSDNPRSEQPERIIDQITAGMADATNAFACPDRHEAIGRAIQIAEESDVVVLAGKGSENYQIFAGHTVDFDDRLVAREWLECLFHEGS